MYPSASTSQSPPGKYACSASTSAIGPDGQFGHTFIGP